VTVGASSAQAQYRVATPTDPRRPRVCFVWTSPAILDLLLQSKTEHAGGAEVQLSMIGRELAARGWAVSFVVCDEGQGAEVVTPDGIRVLSAYRRIGGLPGVRFWCHKLPGLWGALSRAGADVYVVRGRSWLLGVVTVLSRWRGSRAVYWTASAADARRNGGARWGQLSPTAVLGRYGVGKADLLIVQSKGQQHRSLHELHRTSALVRNIWTNGGSTAPAHGSFVLWVGEMRAIKQPWICLEVARRLPGVRFCLVGGRDEGDPSLLDRMRAAASHLPNVALVGHVPFAAIAAYFERARVLLCTSESEGFPNTFLQAWGRGVPVVSTVDPDEVICRHGLGYHGRDPDELAGGIRRLLSRPAHRAAIGQRARDYVRAYHDPSVVIPKLERLLGGLTEARHEAGSTVASPVEPKDSLGLGTQTSASDARIV